MILGAGLLVLVGLGLLVAGVVTGVTALYWGCVAVCVLAAVLLFLVRRQIHATPAALGAAEPETTAEPSPAFQAAARRRQATVPSQQASDRTVSEPDPVESRPAESRPSESEPVESAPAGAVRASSGPDGSAPDDEPPLEEVEVTDLLIIVDLHDEVLVIDEHPRYHLAGCSYLTGRTTIPLPLDEARSDGFTPCGRCSPDRTLADRARARK